MISIYLSGTGNTKHCIEKLMELLAQSAQTIPIEGKETANLLNEARQISKRRIVFLR